MLYQTIHSYMPTLAYGWEVMAGFEEGGGPRSMPTLFSMKSTIVETLETLAACLIVRILSMKENGGFMKAMFLPPKKSSLTTSHTEMILSNTWISTSYFNIFECGFFFLLMTSYTHF